MTLVRPILQDCLEEWVMLSEIFFLKLEAKARASAPDDRTTKRSDERFVPVAPSTPTPTGKR
jgi:hypothetical protein